MDAAVRPRLGVASVTSFRHCSPNVVLDNCYALYFAFEYADGRDPKPNIKPLDERKRVRDLKAGDRVLVFSQPAKLTAVETVRLLQSPEMRFLKKKRGSLLEN